MAVDRLPFEVPSEIRLLLARQSEALRKVAPEHRRRLQAIAPAVRGELRRRLRMLAGDSYSAQETRVALAQVTAMVDEIGTRWGDEVGSELQAIGRRAATVGRESLLDQVDVWANKFRGSVRAISAPDLAADVLDEGLLEYYESSRDFYGREAITKMRTSMARSRLAGESTAQMYERLAKDVEIPEWRAERIVRTEQSFAMHRRQMKDLQDGYGDEASELWRKQLLSTFDNRTGEDSVFVHEQVRKLDEPFEDNQGRVYQHPPNRPNDREVVVHVPAPALVEFGKMPQVGESP